MFYFDAKPTHNLFYPNPIKSSARQCSKIKYTCYPNKQSRSILIKNGTKLGKSALLLYI